MKPYISVLALLTATAACGGADSGGSASATNTAPTLDAGVDQTVNEGATVQLDASATDADGDALTITWSQSSGTAVTLSSTTATNPTFSAPDVTASQSIVFEISVTDGTATSTDTVTITVNDSVAVSSNEWILNTTDERSPYIMDGGTFVEVNVQSVTQAGDLITVQSRAIPNYTVTITQEALDVYEARRSEAFSSGVGTLSLGDVVEFGEDVGYSATCTNGGDGFWPEGGASCPEPQDVSLSFPANPTPATSECETSLGPVGLWVNGVPIYNWYDGASYNGEGFWNQFAFALRSGGMDLCYGHGGGAGNQYHHHNYNACLRQMIGDEGTAHSPVYGYAGDGYPIHGPYHAANDVSESCWQVRDYSAASSTGCGADGARTCTFVDEENISLGTQTVLEGPNAFDNVDVLNASGIYYEDFYYDAACTAQGDKYLDEHNGHDHDALGYHYHATTDENLTPTFPLVNGPDYFGDVGNGSFGCFNRTF